MEVSSSFKQILQNHTGVATRPQSGLYLCMVTLKITCRKWLTELRLNYAIRPQEHVLSPF